MEVECLMCLWVVVSSSSHGLLEVSPLGSPGKTADRQAPDQHMCMVIVMLHIKRDGQRSRLFSLSRTVRSPSCLTTNV